MNIIGLSAFYHESACCLLQDSQLITAVAEERFTRIKHDPRLPIHAFHHCLHVGGIDITEVDCLAYYESPTKKQARQLKWGVPSHVVHDPTWRDPQRVEWAIRQKLGFEGPILYVDHHQSHAASSFYFSGFTDAAILTVDGVGEWATTTYGWGKNNHIHLFEEVHFPHSLGLFYATITAYLGFRVNSGEYKVMGLAPYGQPRYAPQMRTLIHNGDKGQYQLAMRFFDFVQGEYMYHEALCTLLGQPPRQPESAITPFHCDVACSAQLVLEELLLAKVTYLAHQVDSANLCLAGGVALNCVANGRIRREGPFERLFVQPAAGDAGGCLGAAALAYWQLNGRRHTYEPMTHVYLGPQWSTEQIDTIMVATGLDVPRLSEDVLLTAVAERLEKGDVIGWFQGKMEFGPRALGARSILANPMLPNIQDKINVKIKQRETFRPFAPTVLYQHASKHFDLDQYHTPFMLETCLVRSPLPLPGITHVDGSARPQTIQADTNPRYAALLHTFYQRTGCPILLNTSFNRRDEPIVCSPIDALFCLAQSELDALVLEDYLIDKTDLPTNWADLCRVWRHTPTVSTIHEHLYTFV